MGWLSKLRKKVDPRGFYASKYTSVSEVYYRGRVLPDGEEFQLDVRDFFINPLSLELAAVVSGVEGCDDQKAWLLEQWVKSNIQYASEKSLFDLAEFWMLPFETLNIKRGDCEDGAILLANALLASGIAAWKVRLSAGQVKGGDGHCWLTYYCEATGRWVALDWCFMPSDKSVAERPDYKDAGLYEQVWFSWTRDEAYYGAAKIWSSGGGAGEYKVGSGFVRVIVPEKILGHS